MTKADGPRRQADPAALADPAAQALLEGRVPQEGQPDLFRWDPAYLHAQAALERLGLPADHAVLAAQASLERPGVRVNLKPLAARLLREGLESPSPS